MSYVGLPVGYCTASQFGETPDNIVPAVFPAHQEIVNNRTGERVPSAKFSDGSSFSSCIGRFFNIRQYAVVRK